MALFSVNLNFIATLNSVKYWNQKFQNKVYFPLKSNFFKAIQVNTKITDFEFFLKIDHMLRYGRKARRISNFGARIFEQNLLMLISPSLLRYRASSAFLSLVAYRAMSC